MFSRRLAANSCFSDPARQECVFLPLDEAAILPREPGVLALADLVQGLVEVLDDVELVVEDAGLWRVRPRGVGKRLPHVHDGEPDFPALFRPQPREELVQARLGTVLAAEPDRPSPEKVADHDAVGVPLADRDFVDADDLRRGSAGAAELLGQVFHFEALDRLPVEPQFAGHVVNRRAAAPPTDVESEPLRVERIAGQPGNGFLLHGPAPAAENPPDLEVQEHASVAARQVADPPLPAIVEASMPAPADPARRFFDRRRNVTTRAFGSPNTPRTTGSGTKPGNRYASRRRRSFRIAKS